MNPRNFSDKPKCCSATSRIRIGTRQVGRPNLGQANGVAYRKSCSVRKRTSSSESYRSKRFRILAWRKRKPLISRKFR